MSYDFKPTHHIGMTAQGYYIGGATKRKAIKPKPNGLQALSLHELRKLCFAKDTPAIAEYERRLWNGFKD